MEDLVQINGLTFLVIVQSGLMAQHVKKVSKYNSIYEGMFFFMLFHLPCLHKPKNSAAENRISRIDYQTFDNFTLSQIIKSVDPLAVVGLLA